MTTGKPQEINTTLMVGPRNDLILRQLLSRIQEDLGVQARTVGADGDHPFVSLGENGPDGVGETLSKSIAPLLGAGNRKYPQTSTSGHALGTPNEQLRHP